MTEGEEDLVATFEALLSCLEEQLSQNQIWELDVHLRYDELEIAFDLLCSMLRAVGAPLSQQAHDLLEVLAHRLGIEDGRWKDLGKTQIQ